MLRIALIQTVGSDDLDDNLARAVHDIKKAAQKGARIVCLPELFKTRYFPQSKNSEYFVFAEKIPGPATERFARLARLLHVVLIVPLFEKNGRGVYYNTAVVIDADGAILGSYRKAHIPYDPLFYEKYYFKPGNSGFPVFKTRFAPIGVLICYDQWFPEPARALALAGAEIIFYPTAIGWKPEDRANVGRFHSAWETVQRGHAISNGVYVAAANRAGVEGKLKFWGGSFAAGPFGEVIARAGDKAKIVTADCDLGAIKKTRRGWPFFRDRRPGLYRKIADTNRIRSSFV